MTFIKGEKCELRVLEGSDHEISEWQSWVNRGLTTKYLFTGSIPMRKIDIEAKWEEERRAGSVEFGIWTTNLRYAPQYGGMSDKFIGTTGLYAHRDIYRLWEFRILIFHPDYIGAGIGTEATGLVVDYGFKRLNAHRIWLGVNAENLGAIECYKKSGFTEEGRLRK